MTANTAPEIAVPPAAKPEIVRRTRVKTSRDAYSNANVNAHGMHRISIPIASVTGLLTAAVMLVFVILSYVQITEINAAKSTLRTQLSALETEAEQLRVEYAMTFNLKEIEDYAVNTLGMVRMTENGAMAVPSVRTDTGVLLSGGEREESGALSGLIGYLSSLLEYFK